ncbi:IclR family transcriptional regulator [Limnochorda pilosa]|uniref:Glycerol operon regulatory protein n=2 Tax=Limnochorda pilosa TaxID=1555112 RepID=A0A0K2SK12_LIMPI|nr:IclR family transcriptional regulator [Limnochorda pilosa]
MPSPYPTLPPPARGPGAATIQSVVRAITILELLAARGEPVGLGELSEQVGLNRTTLHHLLATLVDLGWLVKDGRRRYAIGSRMLEVTSRHLGSLREFDLGAAARPYMDELWNELNETVHLWVPLPAEALCVEIDFVESTRPLRTVGTLGRPLPLYPTAPGRIFLAAMEPPRVRRYLAATSLLPHTRQTVTGVAELEEIIGRVRAEGAAVDVQEHMEGVVVVAAPVRSKAGSVVGACGLSLPLSRAEDRLPALKERVREVAARIPC